MSCLNPYKGQYPCGKCMYCRIQYSATWSARLYNELETNPEATFLTLTYDEEHNPYTLRKHDLQLYFKRVRRDYSTKLKYFACGEYGDNTARPHYHAILFGTYPDGRLQDNWSSGYVYQGYVSYQSIRYVTDYVLKKYDGRKAKEVYGDIPPPFRLISNGLGRDYLMRHYEQLEQDPHIYINGAKRCLPRYYKDKLQHSTPHHDSKRVYKAFCLQEELDKSMLARELGVFVRWLREHDYPVVRSGSELEDIIVDGYDVERLYWRYQRDRARTLDVNLKARADFYKKGVL